LPSVAARLGEELARIQTIRPPHPDLGFLPSIGPLQHIASFRAYLDHHPQPRPVLEWAARWLETHVPEARAPVLCHRDFRTGNYMLDGADLTGILDWEFAGWGDPDEDIGLVLLQGLALCPARPRGRRHRRARGVLPGLRSRFGPEARSRPGALLGGAGEFALGGDRAAAERSPSELAARATSRPRSSGAAPPNARSSS